jgi:hypothetical protein
MQNIINFASLKLKTKIVRTGRQKMEGTAEKRRAVWYSTLQRFGAVEDRGAGGRAYRLWRSGERWLFICLELYSDKVNCTNREGEKTLDQM